MRRGVSLAIWATGAAVAAGLAFQYHHDARVVAAARPAPSPVLCKINSTAAVAETGETVTTSVGGTIAVGKYKPRYDAAPVYTVRSVGRATSSSVEPRRGAWLVAGVDATNPGCPVVVDPLFFTFTGSDGLTYAPTVQNTKGEFPDVVIARGSHATGALYFDVPPAALPGRAITFTVGASKIQGSWRMPAQLTSAAGPA